MALSKKPLPLKPYAGGSWGPKGAFRHRVRTGENWVSLAKRDGWARAQDLVAFNFGTTDAREVNWYLKNFVGCVLETDDRKNYRFSDEASPGVVFTRTLFPEDKGINTPGWTPPPPPLPDAGDDGTPGWWARTGTWWGIGGKAGGQAGVKGLDVLSAVLFSYETMADRFLLRIFTERTGLGAGFSGGMSVVFVTGIKKPQFLKGIRLGDVDFSVSVGGKWGALAKAVSKIPNAAKYAAAARYGHYVAELADDVDYSVNLMKGLFAGAGVKVGSHEPTVTVIDTGIGGGAELSVYYALNSFEVPWTIDTLT